MSSTSSSPRNPNASVAINDLPVERLIDPDADVYGPILYKSESGHALLCPLSEQWRHDEP